MTAATGTTVLKTALATYAHTKGLKDGTVTAPGIRLEHVEVSPIVGAFRRMVRTLEFDVSEMAITTYLTARAHGQAVTALPVFVLREMRAQGAPAAAVGAGHIDSPDIKPLIPNPREAEAAWYRKTGIYPVNHTVVVKDSLLEADATLAPRLFAAFKEAKAIFLKELGSAAQLSGDAQVLAQRRSIVGDDPLPNGVGRTRKSLEAVIQFARDQKILPRTVDPEEMFARNTLDLE